MTAVLLHPEDDVAVALRPIARGQSVDLAGGTIQALQDIPPGHKLSVRRIERGDPIRKLGEVIGFATDEIPPGCHVHEHNCEIRPFAREAPSAYAPRSWKRPAQARTFLGYRRADGRVGTRNYVAVMSTVACSASLARKIARRAQAELLRLDDEVHGVLGLTHKSGCGLEEGSSDHERLERTLAGFAAHPNVAGCLLVSLGCEVAQASRIAERIRAAAPGSDPERLRIVSIQDSGGSLKAEEAGFKALKELFELARAAKREEVSASELVVGLQCGGSDGYSALSANPALGVASDLLVAEGGTVILAETPEVYGAEHLLAARAVSPEVAEALFRRIRWWNDYASLFGAELSANPSPGNKLGGITTIYEKSLGAVAKGGTSPLTAVYGYAEPVRAKGLVFMDTPGYDPVSVTGLVAGGATIIAFTTGRGSVYGGKPSPVVKIAATTELFERMESDMDFDAGPILRGIPIDTVGQRIFERILAIASGERTKSELLGFGEDEFAPWISGPTF